VGSHLHSWLLDAAEAVLDALTSESMKRLVVEFVILFGRLKLSTSREEASASAGSSSFVVAQVTFVRITRIMTVVLVGLRAPVHILGVSLQEDIIAGVVARHHGVSSFIMRVDELIEHRVSRVVDDSLLAEYASRVLDSLCGLGISAVELRDEVFFNWNKLVAVVRHHLLWPHLLDGHPRRGCVLLLGILVLLYLLSLTHVAAVDGRLGLGAKILIII